MCTDNGPAHAWQLECLEKYGCWQSQSKHKRILLYHPSCSGRLWASSHRPATSCMGSRFGFSISLAVFDLDPRNRRGSERRLKFRIARGQTATDGRLYRLVVSPGLVSVESDTGKRLPLLSIEIRAGNALRRRLQFKSTHHPKSRGLCRSRTTSASDSPPPRERPPEAALHPGPAHRHAPSPGRT